tara:strand:+ start:86 stop:484 length:399 start_codon:yes stop_codon:yes gene_type:complete
MEYDGDVDNFCKFLFENKYKDKCTIQLEFDDIPLDILFEELLYIFNKGIHILYGTFINPSDIQSTHIDLLNKYFNSFGIEFKCLIRKLTDKIPQEIQNKIIIIDKKNIEDYHLMINTEELTIYIYFEICKLF